jgi:putative oxidoreductase
VTTLQRPWLTKAIRLHAAALDAITGWIWPLFDVALRMWIAKFFLVSGMMEAMHLSDSAAQRHLGGWAASIMSSGLHPTLELVSAVLFVLGLLTQLDALVLLILSFVGTVPLESDAQLLVCALLAYYWLAGAGSLSLDNVLGGLASSALAFANTARRAIAAIRRGLLPVFQVLLRVWLAVSLLERPLGEHGAPAFLLDLAHAAPAASAPALNSFLCLAVGALLILGAGTRYLAVFLLLHLCAGAMMGWHHGSGFYWELVLGLIALQGPGPWSVDALIESWLHKTHPELDGKLPRPLAGLPRVVIVGAGFGGLSCAKYLRHSPVSVTLIDRANHHLFQPLLYQVATASLSPGDIATPIRSLFREASNIQVLYGTVTGIDAERRAVKLDSISVPYDYLVLATGATHGYFGNDAWRSSAPGLKRLEDATEIRRRLLTAFEKAELTEDAQERDALLTFLVVGGGPTGVELAGAIAELTRLGMQRDFRRFEPSQARIILVQSGPRILPTFPESLSRVAQRALEKLGVDVRIGSRVEMIDDSGVSVSGERIAARTVLWAAGVVASPAGAWLGAARDGAGRIVVGPNLGVPGMSNVFAIGDTAASNGWNGAGVPGLAPAAKQAGAYVARMIDAQACGRPASGAPFRYRHWGSLAAIGRKAAVVDFGRIKLWGAPAWWFWGMLHVGLLVGMRNRIATVINWFCSYITFRSAIRLITGGESSP